MRSVNSVTEGFTHKGLFCGIVPVYINFDDEEFPLIMERHWAFVPLFTVVQLIFGICIFIRTMVDDDYEPMFPIKITGEL